MKRLVTNDRARVGAWVAGLERAAKAGRLFDGNIGEEIDDTNSGGDAVLPHIGLVRMGA